MSRRNTLMGLKKDISVRTWLRGDDPKTVDCARAALALVPAAMPAD
ncbi:MAG: hypothetical protein QOH71_2347 [Blastocatellia bacterium]|nr:hypothetical protein [Blastocatellia bacterium]